MRVPPMSSPFSSPKRVMDGVKPPSPVSDTVEGSETPPG